MTKAALVLTSQPGVFQFLQQASKQAYTEELYLFIQEENPIQVLKSIETNSHSIYFIDESLSDIFKSNWIAEARRLNSETPIIALLSSKQKKSVQEILIQGADDYLFIESINAETLEKSIRYSQQKRRMEQLIRHQQVRFSQILKKSALGEIASSISHEINNPLVVITGHAQILLSHLEKKNHFSIEDLRKPVQAIAVNAERISKIVRGMKNMGLGIGLERFEKNSLSRLISDAVDFCQSRLVSSDISFKLISSGEIQIECRAHEILQVFVNILTNSIDAIRHLPERWIELELVQHSKFVEIKLTDSGQGIPEEDRERIFDRHFSKKMSEPSTGLGLDISRALLHGHQGEIKYNSASAHTQFIITLPIIPEQPHEENKISILIAENDPDILEILVSEITGPGVEILKARDGLQALSMLNSRPIDLVLTDVNMPEVSGLDVYRHIAKSQLTNTRVALLTGFMDPHMRQSIGANTPVFEKPFDMMELKRYVKSVQRELPSN